MTHSFPTRRSSDLGWNVANATLGFERGTGFVADQIQNSELVERLIAMARARCGLDGLSPAIDDIDFAPRLAMSRAEMARVRAMPYATVPRAANAYPGPERALVKLLFSVDRKSTRPNSRHSCASLMPSSA